MYDGHGGTQTAEYTQERPHSKLISQPAFKDGDYKDAFIKAFVDLDEEMYGGLFFPLFLYLSLFLFLFFYNPHFVTFLLSLSHVLFPFNFIACSNKSARFVFASILDFNFQFQCSSKPVILPFLTSSHGDFTDCYHANLVLFLT